MNYLLLIFLGSGLGGLLRYWATSQIQWLLGGRFPYGTLIVNTTGCFIMGVLFVFLLEKIDGVGEQLRPFLLIGFLGGYTTFSTFSIETLKLYESGDSLGASLNVLLSLGLCLSGTGLGMMLGRHL